MPIRRAGNRRLHLEHLSCVAERRNAATVVIRPRAEHREPEDVADRWADRLLRAYFWRQYGYLHPLLVAVGPFLKPFRAQLKQNH